MSTCPPIPFGTSDAFLEDGVRLLKELLRLDTTNPPGNESIATRYAAEQLQEVGISSQFFETAPGRECLSACYGPDDENCVILSAHVDVVPASAEHWTHPPFSGVEADGCIWGRGAVDMKNMAAYGLAVLRELARNKVEVKRGVKLLLFADEETGCSKGSLAVASEHPEWLKGHVALTEVGGFTTWVEGNRIYPLQIAEKGFVWMRLHIEGTPGHGSMPEGAGALDELARIVTKINSRPFDFRCTPPVQEFLNGVARVLGIPKGPVFKGIGNEKLSDLILDKLVKAPDRVKVFRALLRDTATATMATGGDKLNVIPPKAELTVDCRILPGTDPDTFVETFKQKVPGRDTLEVVDKGPPVLMDSKHPILGTIGEVLQEADPGCHPVNYMISGFTDARSFAQVGTPCYGFSPVWLPPDLSYVNLFHAHDERIPTDGYRWGLACVLEVIRRFCS